jgi:hypothetical protein
MSFGGTFHLGIFFCVRKLIGSLLYATALEKPIDISSSFFFSFSMNEDLI